MAPARDPQLPPASPFHSRASKACFLALATALGAAGAGCKGYCEHDTLPTSCGLNHRGVQMMVCTDGNYRAQGNCQDPDVCRDGTAEAAACGLNGRGTLRQCTRGQWDCTDDPDICVDGQEELTACDALRRSARPCVAGHWGPYGACDDPPPLTIPAPGTNDVVHDAVRNRLYITTSGASGNVRVFNLLTRQFEAPLLSNIALTSITFQGIDLSPDGTFVAVGSSHVGVLYLKNLKTGVSDVFPYTDDLFEGGSYSVAFTSNDAILFSLGHDGAGTGKVPLRWLRMTNIAVGAIANVGRGTMLARSADGATVAFAQANTDSGEWGRYSVATRTITDAAPAGAPIYEIAVNATATQYAIPTEAGLHVFDGSLQPRTVLDGGPGRVPISAAYSPGADELFVAWAGPGASIEVYDALTLQKLRDLEPASGLFSPVSGRAFVDGRLRLSRDGSALFATSGENVVAYPTGQ